MKNLIIIFLCLTTFSCSNKLKPENTKLSRSLEMQQEINNLLNQDAQNKALEKEYLEEIRIAEENNDQEAFRFYLSEYVKVERLKLPEWIKKEPNYVKGGLNIKY